MARPSMCRDCATACSPTSRRKVSSPTTSWSRSTTWRSIRRTCTSRRLRFSRPRGCANCSTTRASIRSAATAAGPTARSRTTSSRRARWRIRSTPDARYDFVMSIARDAFVDGSWIATKDRFSVRDPYDDALITEVADADDALIDRAVDAAARAFTTWRRVPGPERGKQLREMATRMLAEEPQLAQLCSRENGKALKESVAEVRSAASFLAGFAGGAEREYGETIPASHANQRLHAIREPVGPAAVITPWNFPYAMLTRKLGAALAAGCTVVAKPAHQTPLGALAVAQIAEQVGLPPGVFNVVPSAEAARVGGRLLGAPQIRKITFTGSTAVGKSLMRSAADYLKRVSLELGGNAPFVVLADADLD